MIQKFVIVFLFFLSLSSFSEAGIRLITINALGGQTQANYLAETFHIPLIWVGSFLDSSKKERVIDFKRIEEKLKAEECKDGFVMYGAKTFLEYQILDKIVENLGNHFDRALYLVTDAVDQKGRMTNKLVCSICKRTYHQTLKPPTSETHCDYCAAAGSVHLETAFDYMQAELELQEFSKEKDLIIEYFATKNILSSVLTLQDPKKTLERILKKLEKYGIQNQVKDPHFEQHFTTQPKGLVQYFKELNLKGMTVLEFGVGAGHLSKLILSANPDKLIGYEIDPQVKPMEEVGSDPRFELRYDDFTKADLSEFDSSNGNFVIITNPPYSKTPFIVEVAEKLKVKGLLTFTSPKYTGTCFQMTRLMVLNGKDFTPEARGDHFILVGGSFPKTLPMMEN